MDYDLDSETRMMLEAARLERRARCLHRRVGAHLATACRRLAALTKPSR